MHPLLLIRKVSAG
ncbi:hypothetical protein Patl1_11685 [Pistacia atlantica]|uniref:Uncharacterized protein n=2 Tax=Pistacia atlantica TaxID=434234 RepID=A0ACC1A497_9ROSI|nr:hypothetical protein Patl1_11674 [Pistacia atlantica]KAJ0083182.1 hypothetical protein Patl1_11685 [Pistacia atlantica]